MSNDTRITAAVLTVSDSRRPENDASGDRLTALLNQFGADVVDRSIVADDTEEIVGRLNDLLGRGIDLILTTGGTGFAPRDNTPEATRRVIEREAPGIAEAIRNGTAAKTPMAMISRGVSGIAGSTLIINLPGSPKAVEECFEVVRPVLNHAVRILRGTTDHN